MAYAIVASSPGAHVALSSGLDQRMSGIHLRYHNSLSIHLDKVTVYTIGSAY